MTNAATAEEAIKRKPTQRESREKPEVGAVAHAITILKVIGASRKSIGVNEIARRVGLHKSTVSRLLATLVTHGFLERGENDGRFSLGFELIALAGPLIADLDVVNAARPALQALADETGESIYIAVWNGRDTIMIEQAVGEHAVTHYARPGTAMPTHASAAGKIFMAFLPAAKHAAMLQPLPRYTPFTKLGDELEAELEDIRSRGIAFNDQEYEIESCGVAAPVRDVRGQVVGALTVAAPKHRFDPRQQVKLAMSTARYAEELSRRMGYVGR
ncbi:IclR family transcriptional regulator [Consotaella aegiceratis]|uniref:IclR family transcriptional regulator n=1 Tax=Consotaella aegiceratis TaxID=3097961 RepID=UPI002F40A106